MMVVLVLSLVLSLVLVAVFMFVVVREYRSDGVRGS